MLWTLVGLAIINWSVTLLSPASYFPPLAVLMVIAGFWGLGLVIVSLVDLSAYPAIQRHSNHLAWASAILTLVLMAAWTYLQFHNNPAYGTDELAFDQYAAQLLHHGLNPYAHSMGPAFPMFRLSPDQYTYTTSGAEVLSLSYPSLSFLLYWPFIALGWTTEAGNAVDMIAWLVTILMMFVLLPKNVRAVALLIGVADVYLGTVTGGVTDVLYIPFLILAAYKWDRFGTSRRSYIGPIALGLAMAVKQTPWPLLVFMLVAIALDEFDRAGLDAALRRAGRYLGVVLVAFLIPNLPFIILSPHAWFNGVITPFEAKMVPSGQGIVALTMFAHLGGGSLVAFSVAMVLVGVLVLGAFIATYPLLRPVTFLLAAIVYLFAARSQTNYLIEFVPVAIIGAVTIGPARWPALTLLPETRARLRSSQPLAAVREWTTSALSHTPSARGPLRSRRWGVALAAVATLAAASVLYTLTTPSPLSVRITGFETTGFLGGIKELSVDVRNNTDKPLRPHYTIQTKNGDTTFWKIWLGPHTIAPHHTGQLQLRAPNYPAEPGLGDGFSVVAFTTKPAAVSVSHRFLKNLVRTILYPRAVNNAIPVGKPITLRVQLLNHFNEPLRHRHVAIYMSQLVYTSVGTRTGTAIMNGQPKPTRKPAISYTNAQGIATFKVVGLVANSVPITFSAHLKDKSANYVYGSTGFLNITFKPAPGGVRPPAGTAPPKASTITVPGGGSTTSVTTTTPVTTTGTATSTAPTGGTIP